jgi:hypothetical protein
MEENPSVEQLLVQLNSQASVLEAEEVRIRLKDYINYLLLQDFNKLVNVLYRVDVSETKLKQILHDDPQTDAADLITDLLIQRQKEKLEIKKSFPSPSDIPEEERW